MAYSTEELEDLCLAAIKKHNIRFFKWLNGYIAPSLSTIKEHGLAQSVPIKKALDENRVKRLETLHKKMADSDHPTLIIAELKLLSASMGDMEALDALNGNHQNNAVTGEMKLVIERRTITGREKDD